MDNGTVTQLLQETISLAEEDGQTQPMEAFVKFVGEMLPPDVIQQLEDILDDENFLATIWSDKYEIAEETSNDDSIAPGLCLICERKARLTRHHVFPRETHGRLIKQGYDSAYLNTTIPICRMCHNTVHRFFTNEELSRAFYTVDLLMADEKFLRYAKWAASQK